MGERVAARAARGVLIPEEGADQRHKLIIHEGFVQECVSARLKEGRAFPFRAEADDEGVGTSRAQEAGDFRSAHAGHAVVGDDDAVASVPNGVQGGLSVSAAADLEPVRAQKIAESVADHLVVIDYQDRSFSRHITPPRRKSASSDIKALPFS
jgi:hypothetical protein